METTILALKFYYEVKIHILTKDFMAKNVQSQSLKLFVKRNMVVQPIEL